METTLPKQQVCARCSTPLPSNAPEGLCPKCLIDQGITGETTIPNDPKLSGANAPGLEEMGRHFPQFEIIELLGLGGMGIVYKARQPNLDRLVALKILPLEAGQNAAFTERFSREARALARLNHPGIVGIYDFGRAGPYYFFAMQYVDGCNLHQLMRARKIASREALSIVTQICEALQYAHDEGVVHRDIKPGNILLDKKGRVRIADFGLAKLFGQVDQTAPDLSLTQTDAIMGTPNYMAPEQMEHPQEVDHRADIYSLGVVFYEMLTGELPLGRFAPPSEKVQIDVRVDEVVLRTLEKQPERRYQTARAVKNDVDPLTTDSSLAPSRPASATIGAKPLSARRWSLVLVGCLTLISLSFIFYHRKAILPEQPIFYTFAGITGFVRGPDGPQLSSARIREYGLTSSQAGALNKIFPRYYSDFVSLERQHTTISKDDKGHVHVVISPFRDETIALAERLNAEIRGVIGRDILNPKLPGNIRNFGLFRHAGETGVNAELWKSGPIYYFHEDHAPYSYAGASFGGHDRGSQGKSFQEAFPEEYWIYWPENL